jgi:methionyl-tRNA formyltransferase
MHTGIISNSDECIPLAYTLANQGLQVCIFFSPPPDNYICEKVTKLLQIAGIPYTIEKDPKTDVYKWLAKEHPPVIFILGYKYLLEVKKIEVLNITAFNIHSGPLPSFRGPVPVFWQLKQGQPSLGISIHRLSAKFDDGEVVWKKETPNMPYYNYSYVHQLFSRLCVEGVQFILQAMQSRMPLPDIREKGKVPAYHKRPQLADVMINWPVMTAAEISNLIRACNPWNKGAQTLFNQQEIKLMDAAVLDTPVVEAAGTILQDDDRLLIACADGKVINVNMLYTGDFFVPAYHAAAWGFLKGKIFG